ncbi:MAG: hypothetical protein MHM6MM_008236, partial [Cercozoa sp. M6MM]
MFVRRKDVQNRWLQLSDFLHCSNAIESLPDVCTHSLNTIGTRVLLLKSSLEQSESRMSVESFRGAVSTDDQSGSQCAQDVMLELHRTQSAQLRRRSDSPDPFNVEETSETTGGLSRVHSSHALIEVVASQERRQLQAATCADHDLWIRVAFDMLAGGTHSMFRTPSNSLEDRNRRQRSQSPVPDPSATVMVDDLIEVLGSKAV